MGKIHSGGESLAAKKYASDYRIEERVTAGGKTVRERIYQGVRYRFKESPAVIRRLRVQLIALSCAIAALLLPMLFVNTGMGRKMYIVLPTVASFVPLYLLLAGARRLGFPETPFIREHRDKTDIRISGAGVCLMAFLGISAVGCGVYAVLYGLSGMEILCTACLAAALALAVFIFTQRKKAATEAVK